MNEAQERLLHVAGIAVVALESALDEHVERSAVGGAFQPFKVTLDTLDQRSADRGLIGFQ
jgi:hypothetical protein